MLIIFALKQCHIYRPIHNWPLCFSWTLILFPSLSHTLPLFSFLFYSFPPWFTPNKRDMTNTLKKPTQSSKFSRVLRALDAQARTLA